MKNQLQELFEKLESNDKGFAQRASSYCTDAFTVAFGDMEEGGVSIHEHDGHLATVDKAQPVQAMALGIGLIKAALELEPQLGAGHVLNFGPGDPENGKAAKRRQTEEDKDKAEAGTIEEIQPPAGKPSDESVIADRKVTFTTGEYMAQCDYEAIGEITLSYDDDKLLPAMIEGVSPTEALSIGLVLAKAALELKPELAAQIPERFPAMAAGDK